MRNFSNILLVILLVFSATFKAKAQAVDMALLSPFVAPSPTSYPGTASISLAIVAEILDEQLSSDDLGISYATLTISLSNLQGSASILPTGAGADLFTWQYNAVQNVYIGKSKDALMPADAILPISFANLPVIAAVTTNTTGFLANLTPPGDLYTSESNDDAVRIYTSAPLPVTLVSFTAKKEGSVALLNWATTEETNSDHFEIQHSVSGKEWVNVGEVASSGDSKVLKNYSFSHVKPVHGQNLYRLKMIDRDQTFAFSRIQSVSFEGIAAADLSVYPNPSTDKLFIRDNGTVKEVVINNLNGSAVYKASSSFASGSGLIDVTNLPQGMYIVKVTRTNGLVSTSKVVVNK
ncbi:T9SS type A sorting domain-containing protein [Dyadobacter sp. CY345]|uniref:T9SS type A sorting domain-containing protein n=1 Tax=Dyadobacter sp. CY345 TaxID=2909335 RepID=UPI001F45C582|nr:T9SS type A sorting domain-containing protein [Dyadobacter sp. CY345]MCF2445021.1 T9SS type A sorting domain-containing protein [Dyadobacter sp. CY345]